MFQYLNLSKYIDEYWKMFGCVKFFESLYRGNRGVELRILGTNTYRQFSSMMIFCRYNASRHGRKYD